MLGKIVSAAGGLITAALLATIGYVDNVPQPGDPATQKVFWITMLMWLGMMILGWVCSIIAMHWYPLTAEKMVEVQAANKIRKQENLAAQKAAERFGLLYFQRDTRLYRIGKNRPCRTSALRLF